MSSWIPRPTRGTGAAYVERGLIIFAVLWQIAWTLTDILPRLLGRGGWPLGLSVVTGLSWIVVVATLWGPDALRRRRPLALALNLATLSIAAAALATLEVEPGSWPLGTIAAVRAAVFATLVLRTLPGLAMASLIALASGIILVAGPAGVSAEDATLETLYPVAMALGAAVLASALRRAGRRIDVAHQRLAEEETRRMAQEAVARATADHERRIHDQVLNTLAAIGRGGTPSAGADSATLRRQCRSAAASLQLLASGATTTREEAQALFDAAIEDLPDDWTHSIRIDAATFEGVPEYVVDAFGRAAAEAVRNAARHSRGRRLTIRGERIDGAARVTIDDDGVGLSADMQPGLGMTRSMQAAMVDSGGSVQWSSSPDGGTRVTLSWSGPRGESQKEAGLDWEFDTVRVLTTIGPPFLIAFLSYAFIVVAAGWPFYPNPWWAAGWLAVAVATAPIVGAIPRIAERFGFTGGPSWSPRVIGGVAIAVAAAIAVVRMESWAVASASMPIWVTWSSEVAVSLLFMTILLGPPWVLIPVLAGWVVAQGGSPWELLQPGAIMLMVAALFAASMRRRARDYARASAALIAERARIQAAEEDEQRRRSRFAVLAEHTGPLLEGVSSGRLDPEDPDVRRQCLLEERVARSVVRVDRDAGFVQEVLHEAVITGRARGSFIDADMLGAPESPDPPGDYVALRRDILATVRWELAAGDQARLTGGWEEGRPVFRLLTGLDGAEELREWGMADAG